MNPWYSTPNTMPAPLTDYNVRIRYWFGKPFLARYDADNEVWISNSNGLTYPVWSISRFQLPEDFPVTSFVLPLSSSGDGSEVSTLQLTFSAATSLKISGTGLFYDDAAGTINPGNVRFADSGSIQTFYIRVPSGSCTINIVNGLDLITQFNEFSTETNSPAIGDLLLSNLPVNLTYFRCIGSNTITGNISNFSINLLLFLCYGSNTITGNISNLPINVTYFECGGYNTITGDISNLPVNVTYFECTGSNTITGDITNLPVNLYYFYCTGSNTITGDISNLPINLTVFYCAGSNTITGNISNLPVNLTFFLCVGSNTITGDISNLPVNLYYFYCVGSNTITGDISNLPVNLTFFLCVGSNTITGDISNLPVNLYYFYCVGSNTITGDISNLPINVTYFECGGSNTINSYTSRFWSTKPVTFILDGLSSLSSTDVDQLLIDFDTDLTWSAGNKITITGNCGARTAASDAAVANMESEGAEISTN